MLDRNSLVIRAIESIELAGISEIISPEYTPTISLGDSLEPELQLITATAIVAAKNAFFMMI